MAKGKIKVFYRKVSGLLNQMMVTGILFFMKATLKTPIM